MKVVALVSGGKDSCYAMMRCLDYGHEIVALANLLPLDDSVDELDSFMYQTVGHQIVVAYAQCMGLPLFRRRIQGGSRARELRYSLTEGDEVEDLFLLLKEVQKSFPTVGGVSCGAIASDYQRMRVENVCSRLGLVSLAFLWRQQQASLLQEMIACGIQAVLVKVAAIGLNPHTHLGKSLAEMQPLLTDLNNLYGINVCGEGGEYETLTLDCLLFKNFKIVLDKYEVRLHSPDTIAPVGVLHCTAFHLESKMCGSLPEQMLSTHFVTEVEGNCGENVMQHQKSPVSIMEPSPHDRSELNLHIASRRQAGSLSIISCWMRSCMSDDDIQHEMNLVLTSVYGELERDGLGWGNVLYIHLYVDDMGAFTVVNQTYMQHITEQLCIRGVPSRSTVGLALKNSGMGSIMVEVIASENTNKKVLHVQSISCWAPSCIGPYSQATLHNGMLYMAGQLGLDPPTMVLVSGGAASEMKQALENCEAVAQIFSTSVMHSSISILVYCSLSAGITERRGIEAMLDKFIGLRREGDASRVSSSKVPVLYVQVPALPKGAILEVEPFLHVPCCQEGYINEGFTLRRDFCGLSDEACQWESSACHGSIVEGYMCRAFCSISLICKLQSSDRMCSTFQIIPSDLGQPDLQWELKSCLKAFSKMLDKACLCWEDMLAFRVLFVAERVSLGAITEAWKHALTGFLSSAVLTNQEVPQKYTSTEGLTSLEPLFLPVLGVGQNANMDDLVTIDLLALKL